MGTRGDCTIGDGGVSLGRGSSGSLMVTLGQLRRTRVLIAEDEWIVAVALRRQVEAQGYEVTGVVGTGAEVLRAHRDGQPDVVFMDVQMPVMDGLAATRELMVTSPHPVVIVTGNASLQEAAEDAGAMGYAVKPLRPHQIPSLIAEAQQRFARFVRVHEEEGTCEAALGAWPVVQQAARALMQAEGLPEEPAFARLQAVATEAKRTLREQALRVLAR